MIDITMRLKRIISIAFLLCLLFFSYSNFAVAADGKMRRDLFFGEEFFEELPLEILAEQDSYQVWQELALSSVSGAEEDFSPLISFAVSPDGTIAMITRDDHLLLLSEDGGMQIRQTFSFHGDGIIGIAWHGNNVCLFFLRGERLVELTQDGQFVCAAKLQRYNYAVEKQLETIFFRTQATDSAANTYELIVGRHIFPTTKFSYSFTRLERIDPGGTITEIYNVEKAVLLTQGFLLFLALAFATLLIMSITLKCIRSSDGSLGDNNFCNNKDCQSGDSISLQIKSQEENEKK